MPVKPETTQLATANNSLNARELKKTERQVRGQAKYLDFLSRNGGWATFDEYAQLIGATADVVKERVNALELITVKIDGVTHIPLYQYDECRNEELYGLTDINKVLLGDCLLGNSYTTTWWLSGANPRRELLVAGGNQTKTCDRLMAQARLAGEMER